MSEAKLVATRDAFGEVLIELGNEFDDLVVVDADNARATKTIQFAARFPDRFINVGVAEQNMVGVASGLALAGKIPLISTHAIFLCGRAFEQIRNAVAYGNLNVKCIGTHGGISVGQDGPTHFAIEDIALMRVLPRMTVIVPADAIETRRAIRAVIQHEGPTYVRLGRAPIPIVSSEKDTFVIGRGILCIDGSDVAIIACGLMVSKALEAQALLQNKGIHAAVVNMHTIKPLDRTLLHMLCIQCGAIVVAEEHSIYGGLGGAVAEAVTADCPVPIEFVGVQDTFAESGSHEALLTHYGLDAAEMVAAALRAIKRKG